MSDPHAEMANQNKGPSPPRQRHSLLRETLLGALGEEIANSASHDLGFSDALETRSGCFALTWIESSPDWTMPNAPGN
jgi:hypothetical protein